MEPTVGELFIVACLLILIQKCQKIQLPMNKLDQVKATCKHCETIKSFTFRSTLVPRFMFCTFMGEQHRRLHVK